MADRSSFSSFADLKDLQNQLRRQEAAQAQARANAIEVKAGTEHLNPLKQQAARAQAAVAAAAASDPAPAAAAGGAAATGANAGAAKEARNISDARPLSGRERSERSEGQRRSGRSVHKERQSSGEGENGSEHQRGERRNSERRPSEHRSGERRSRTNSDKERNSAGNRNEDSIKLSHALNRLQRKADSMNEHALKDKERQREKNLEHTAEKTSGTRPQRSTRSDSAASSSNGRSEDQAVKLAQSRRKERRNQARSNNRAPLLNGRYFDQEALKAVKAGQDLICYQARRDLYRKLRELDTLILQEMERLASAPVVESKGMAVPQTKEQTNDTAPLQAAVSGADQVAASAATAETAAAAAAGAAEAAAGAAGAATDQDIQGGAVRKSKEELLAQVLALGSVGLKRLEILELLESEKQRLVQREEHLPVLEYPESLPVSQRREEIVAAIKKNQVVIIAGETGSGKTTQIPKMCLEAGFGRKGLIGHTQPRRIAARAVAARIASEMHEELGRSVSYKVRFTDIGSADAYIKLMTDGILLAELSTDRLLLNYDVIIIDEAHERSLNIDFLLGYLKNLLHRRPELKLIITSATIDVERFSEHFNHAPIIEVSGRTYPVEVVYMPLLEDGRGVYIESHDGSGRYEKDPHSSGRAAAAAAAAAAAPGPDEVLGEGPGAWHDYQYQSVGGGMAAMRAAAAASVAAAGAGSVSSAAHRPVRSAAADDESDGDPIDLRQGILQAFHYLQKRGRGDVLVFLPGERDILEISQFLRRSNLRDTEIVPLYARLATAEQNKIFTEHTGVRVVLATNVAETSLTVPGIKYVIDPGLARISRYSARTKVQRLPIEPISQASANQRKGRCGRVSDGICVRLYSREDFMNRPEFTDPEILRTNLASVLLQMASLRLGRIENFPFIDAPQPRQVTDGLRLLDELGAVDSGTTVTGSRGAGGDSAADTTRSGAGDNGDESEMLHLTPTGRILARLPCDPRLGRMIVEADKCHSLTEVLVIASALAVMDPREYPLDRKEAATQMHRRFNDEKSDFMSILKLYDYLRNLQATLSSSALRRQLKQEFISFLRMREWFDVLRQLRASVQTMGMKFNEEAATYEEIHRALVSGLLSHLGMLEPNGNNYIGARGSRFVIFPASPLAKKPPRWICASELSETSRLFARTVAAIDPAYAEETAGHLIRNSYNEPHWSKKNGAVMAYLTRSVYGLPIVQKRLVQYQAIDPKLCHELMIRDGLVGGNIECNHRFYQHNLSLIDDVEYLEDKVRRRDLLVDSVTLEQFYQERIPEHICNMRDFDRWWREKSKQDAAYLNFSYELIAKGDILSIEDQLYPEFWHQGSMRFKLDYVFDVGGERDGVTVHIPITVLNQVRADDFLWQIPGLRQELFASLIRSLPKRLRRNLIPAPEYAKALAQSLRCYTDKVCSPDVAGTAASVAGGTGAPGTTGAARNDGAGAGAAGKKVTMENLFVAVARELTRMGGEIIDVEDFDRSLIEPYLFMNFSIEDVNGKEMAFGKDFTLLSARLQNQAREALHQVVKSHRVTAPAQSWQYGSIKKEQVTRQGSLRITAYPALTDRGDGVTLELYDSPARQLRAMRQGAIKLLALSLKTPTTYLETHLPNRAKLSMYYQPLGSIKELIFDLMMCAINNIMMQNGGIPWDEDSFNRLREVVRGGLNDEALNVAKTVEQSLVKAHELKRLLKGSISFELTRSYADISHQLDNLVYKGFISDTGMEHLKELPRYLQAALERIQRLNRDVVRDQMYLRVLENLEDDYQKCLSSYHAELVPEPLLEVKWMLEELRVSYFAQHLGVIGPISDKRITSELDRITREYPPQK